MFQIKGDLKDVAIAPTGRFIMVSTKKTKIYVYTLKGRNTLILFTMQHYAVCIICVYVFPKAILPRKLTYTPSLGELLHTIETAQGSNGQVMVSPCNDFIACSGFTPEVHLWAVQYKKSGAAMAYDQVRWVVASWTWSTARV